MLRKRKGISNLVFVAVIALILVLVGCVPATPGPVAPPPSVEPPTEAPAEAPDAEAPSRPGGTLTVGHHLDPATLDPTGTTTAAFQSIYGQISEQLVMFDTEKRDIKPWLVTEWEWVDENTLRLKLREGVKFTNGEEWNAEAAKYSLDVLGSAKPYSMWIGDSYDRAEVVDEYTVDLHVNSQAGAWLSILARGGFAYPPGYAEEVGLEAFGNKPIGTGPYKLAEWVKDDHTMLEANMDYWGGPPPLDQIVFRVIPEEAARLAALETGEVDIVTNLSAASAKRIEGNSELALMERRGLRMFGTFFDMDRDSPVQDKLVRQALNYAVDKEGLVKLFGGYASPMTPQWLTPDTIGYNTDLEMYNYDPEKAKEMLAEAGYPDGFETELYYTLNRYPLDKEMGEAVSGYLEAVGVKVKQSPLEYGEFRRLHVADGPLDMGEMHQWGLLLPPDAFMTLITLRWQEDRRPLYRHFSPVSELDELLEAGGEVTDPEERMGIYKSISEILADDPFSIYLVIPNDIYGVSAEVQNFVPRADQVLWLHDVYKE